MGKEHPPPSSMRKLGFVMAELAIIGTIIVLLIYLTKYKGPLATLDVPKYNYYQYHAVVRVPWWSCEVLLVSPFVLA